MKFRIDLDASEIRDAIDAADGVDELRLIIEGAVNKNGKTTIDNKYLLGEIVEEYVRNI